MDQKRGLTRRALAPLVAGAALSTASACSPPRRSQPKTRRFPPGFQWGVATSAFQIEGALDADGRGPSIWDVFSRNPAHIADRSDASVATDSYRRYTDDVDLIASAGLPAYRFSISWSRVMPEGAGAVNDKGLGYYSRLGDALLTRGIEPYATLFHWDLPQALFEKGGWASRDTAKRLADYSAVVAERLGDKLKNFIVLNEAAVHTVAGHLLGLQAPGLKAAKLLGPVTHHQNLGQGLAIQALRAARSGLAVGTTMALQPSRPVGGPLCMWNDLPAHAFDGVWNGAYLDPLLKGSYPWVTHSYVEPFIKGGDMAITRQPIDFLGVNYYSPAYIKLDRSNPSYIGPGDPPGGVPLDAFGREIDPSGLGEILTRLRHHYANPKVLITENGASDPLSATAPAILDDKFRIDYLRRHLEAVKIAMEQGSRIGGYFVWSLADNWEWEYGFTSKFGLCAMDRKTGTRMPKASYEWLKTLAKTNVLPAV